MISARWPKLKRTQLAALGLATCWLPSIGLAQSEPSPSDALNPSALTRAQGSELGTQGPTQQADGANLPVPLPAKAEPAPEAPAPDVPAPASSTNEPASDPAKPLTASSSDASSRKLQTIVIQAIDSLDASRLPNRQRTTQGLQNAIAQLEKYINLSSPNGQAWNKFLRLETLKKELAAERPNLATLVELELNMRQNYLGLELLPYQAVRRGIGDVIRALRYGSQPERTVEQLEQKLKLLVDDLDKPADGAASDRALEVGLIANYLHEMNQAPEALSQLQQQFSSPNVQVFVQESAVNRMLFRSVAEPSPVNECLLGTHIVGRACLVGAVNVDMLPMVGGVSMQLNLNANITTQSNGYNRGVVLGTTGHSPVNASKQIFVTPTGISSSPTSVATNLQTSINSIDHRLRVVRRIAGRKAAEQKPLADAIAEGRLQNRIRNQYDDQVNQQLAEANVRLASLQSQAPPELARLGIPKPQLDYYSTNFALHANIKQAAAFQLSAEQPSSLVKPQSSDIVAEVHQSAVVNGLDIVLGDRTIRNVDLDDYARQATGSVSEEIQNETDGEPWSITLAAFRPVEIEFDDGLATIKLRIVRMTRGAQALEDSSIVTAVYRPTFADGVLTLDREGPVNVSFTRASRGLRVVTLRSFLKGKFDMFFKEQFVTKPLDQMALPAGVPHFDVDSLQLDDGWVQVGLR